MNANKTNKSNFAYQAVYTYLLNWIEALPSDVEQRLPSLRQMALRLNVSLTTIKYAYSLLEDEGLVYARPKLGFYTRVCSSVLPIERSASLLDTVFSSARQPGMLALSSDAPAMLLSLERPLLMIERELARRYPRSPAPLYQPFGELELRSVLADRYTRSPHRCWQAEHVFIGSDLRSILELSLRGLSLDGKVAMVESPCSWVVLRQLLAAGMTIIEVPLAEDGRLDLLQLRRVLDTEPVSVAFLSSTTNVPQGGMVSAADKQQVCRWLAEHDVWLFENDSYGEFCFQPAAARYRDFANPDRLLVFSTFDKVIGAEAPYGYLLCRGHTEQLRHLFLQRAFRLSPIRQKAIAKLFTTRRVELHVKALHKLLYERMQHMKALLKAHGQGCLRIIEPRGGASFWLESNRSVDMRRVFERLLAQGIVIAPGEIFSQAGLWRNHLRLCYTLDWDKDIPHALRCLVKAVQDEAVRGRFQTP